MLALTRTPSGEGGDGHLEMMGRMGREEARRLYLDSRTSNAPLASTTLNLRPLDHSHVHHVQNGYAYASLPSSPVYARRLLAVALEAYISIISLHIPYFIISTSMYKSLSLTQHPTTTNPQTTTFSCNSVYIFTNQILDMPDSHSCRM